MITIVRLLQEGFTWSWVWSLSLSVEQISPRSQATLTWNEGSFKQINNTNWKYLRTNISVLFFAVIRQRWSRDWRTSKLKRKSCNSIYWDWNELWSYVMKITRNFSLYSCKVYIELLLNEIDILITSFYRKINHINKRLSLLVVHISYKHQLCGFTWSISV